MLERLADPYVRSRIRQKIAEVSPISRSNISQLVTLCLNSPVRNHGFNYRASKPQRKSRGTETGRCDDDRGCACTSTRVKAGAFPLRATGPLSLTLPIRPPASPHPFAPLSIVCYLPGGVGHATDGRCPHGDVGLLLPAASSRGCGQGKAPALRPGQVGSQWLCNDDGRLVAASVGGRACGVGLRHRP